MAAANDRVDPAALGGVLADIEASPTPYHAVERAVALLEAAGFSPSVAGETGGGRRFVADGGFLAAWIDPGAADHERPHRFVVVGAHTDSPNLRVRSRPDVTSAGWAQVGVEVYGGVLLNSWLDRDLGLAGRVVVRSGGALETRLVRIDEPMLRIPQLAIHLDREIREKGLQLDPQQHAVPLWATTATAEGDGTADGEAGALVRLVADRLGVAVADVVSFDLMCFDTQAPAIVGRDGDLYASARIDNQTSCFAAVRGLVDIADEVPDDGRVPVVVLFDHEEVGSETATGASGARLADALESISADRGVDRVGHLAAMRRSYVVSADGAHATHPNYVGKHEPNHHIHTNGGVVVKRNANQRYASDATSEAPFRAACADAGVPVQTYIHRNDLPCGSTIGPITAAQLAVRTVDVGAPQLAMHSIREMGGTADVDFLRRALGAVWTSTHV